MSETRERGWEKVAGGWLLFFLAIIWLQGPVGEFIFFGALAVVILWLPAVFVFSMLRSVFGGLSAWNDRMNQRSADRTAKRQARRAARQAQWQPPAEKEPSPTQVAAEAHRRFRANVARIMASALDPEVKEAMIRDEQLKLEDRLHDALE